MSIAGLDSLPYYSRLRSLRLGHNKIHPYCLHGIPYNILKKYTEVQFCVLSSSLFGQGVLKEQRLPRNSPHEQRSLAVETLIPQVTGVALPSGPSTEPPFRKPGVENRRLSRQGDQNIVGGISIRIRPQGKLRELSPSRVFTQGTCDCNFYCGQH